MENSCVLGWGTVGRATAKAFGISKYYSRSDSNITLDEASQCKYIFVCLPTNVKDGKYETEDIEIICDLVGSEDNIIILRSTVYPGFSSFLSREYGLNVVFNPEFLSEDTAENDALNPDLVVIGSDDPKLSREVKGLYTARFKHVEPLVTDSITAEFIKIGLNGFFTTKVVFANEIFDYAQMVGANYEVFKKIVERHRWGSKNHFDIYHKNGRGAGGKCLKKDMEALHYYSGRSFFSIVKNINKLLLEETGKK